MGAAKKTAVLPLAGREVTISNPDKIYFPEAGITKLTLVQYYLAVAEGALRGIGGRPLVMKRYVDGAAAPAFYQKRAPEPRPDWIETVTLFFPSGRTAVEVVIKDVSQLAWLVNLGCIDLHPHPVRASDLDHPDELRIDLDPVPGVPWHDVVEVALLCRQVLLEHDLVAFAKTSGSRGMHLNVRLYPRWGFDDVRRAALAVAREVERRAPALATSAWWKEERHGVFIDYNQNAKDRTTAAAYSVRPTPDARVSMPLSWDEVPGCNPADFTLATVPALFLARGDRAAAIDDSPGSLAQLLQLADGQAAAGLGDAPWPPHYEKRAGEAPRVMPSRRRKTAAGQGQGGVATTPAADSAKPPSPTGRRKSSMPLIIVAQAQRREEALAALERWKERHPAIAAQLAPADVLVDSMRGRSTTWTRVRINLRAIPAQERPAQEPLEVDFDPWARP